jgi:hypothetical protein
MVIDNWLYKYLGVIDTISILISQASSFIAAQQIVWKGATIYDLLD